MAAADAGKFHIYPVETIDDAVSLLTGLPAGERDKQGRFPEGSINDRVQQRLHALSKIRQEFAETAKAERGKSP